MSNLLEKEKERKENIERIEKLSQHEDFYETFNQVVQDALTTDEEFNLAEYIIHAYKNNNPDEMLTAVCGYCMNTLLNQTEERLNEEL